MSQRRYQQEIDKLIAPVRRAYFKWVQERVGFARIADVERFIESEQVDAILRSFGIDDASLSELTESLRQVYVSAGAFEAPAVQITFSVRNPAAEAWLREDSSRLVTGVIESQREAIRETLAARMISGDNPRTTALDLAGRVDATGRRRGGIIGLSRPQARYVAAAKSELRSGDPAAMQKYLSRSRRDKRFDSTVRNAIDSGRRLNKATADKIAGRYSDKLLQLRGETIARTETIHSFNAAREQAWVQAVDEGKISSSSVTSEWSATMDNRTRDSHRAMNGQRREHGAPFQSPTGALLRFPGDTSLGASGEDVIDCRCHLIKRADFIGEALRRNSGRRGARSG